MTLGTQPASSPVLVRATAEHGEIAYAYRWWGCGYEIGVGEASYGVRRIGSIGPLACGTPIPRLAWRGREIALVSAEGLDLGVWPPLP